VPRFVSGQRKLCGDNKGAGDEFSGDGIDGRGGGCKIRYRLFSLSATLRRKRQRPRGREKDTKGGRDKSWERFVWTECRQREFGTETRRGPTLPRRVDKEEKLDDALRERVNCRPFWIARAVSRIHIDPCRFLEREGIRDAASRDALAGADNEP